MRRPRRTLTKLLLLGAIVSALVVLARWWLVDFARISSPSMAPLLEGSLESGDHVVILKTSLARRPGRRYDLAVFRTNQEWSGVLHPVSTIKRMLGLPFEKILLDDGELLIYPGSSDPKPDDDAKPNIDAKPHDRFDELLVPIAELVAAQDRNLGFFWDQQRGEFGPAGLSMNGAGKTPALLRYDGPHQGKVTDGYLDQAGHFHDSHVPPILVNDMRFQIGLTVEDDHGYLELTLRDGVTLFQLQLFGRNGEGRTRLTKDDTETTNQPPPVLIEAGRSYQLDFYNIDGDVGFYLGGQEMVIHHDRYGGRVGARARDERNAPELGVHGMRVLIQRVTLNRDLYWISEGTYAVGNPLSLKDEYFMLGDNSAESSDSRALGPVPAGDLVGRPIAIFYPWHRWRRL